MTDGSDVSPRCNVKPLLCDTKDSDDRDDGQQLALDATARTHRNTRRCTVALGRLCTDMAKGICDCQCRSRTLYYYWPTSLKRGSAIVVRLHSFNSNCRSMPRYAPLFRPTGDQENRDKSGYGPRRLRILSPIGRERERARKRLSLIHAHCTLHECGSSEHVSLSLSLGNERKNKEKSGGGRVTRAGRRRRRTRTGDPTSDD